MAKDEFIVDLAEKLKALRLIRKQAGYSQQELADLVGIHQSQIARLENGSWKKSTHLKTFVEIIRVIDKLQIQNIESE